MSRAPQAQGRADDSSPRPISEADKSLIFNPLKMRNLRVKNRLFRSSISGTFDHYDGHGSDARVNWEESFARGGIGAIISSFVPVTVRGRILTRYATIDHDDKIPFWARVGERVHRHDAKFILQLSHSGRQQDVGGVENLYRKAQSSTDKKDYFHGILCEAMSKRDIERTVQEFAAAAKRAKDAGLDGVELHGGNGYLITQFLSSGINDRKDEYGGDVAGRARFVVEIVRAIRERVGRDFQLQMKINGVDHNDWLYPWERKGNTLDDTVAIIKLLEDNGAGIDAVHVSSGSTFPHPRNPPGDFPVREAVRWYDGMLSSGVRTRLNYAVFKSPLFGPLFRRYWLHRRGQLIEGINVAYARHIKQHTQLPVLCTGGFQHADKIAEALRQGACDAVTIARPLIANRNLPLVLQRMNGPEKPCTYCNRCLLNDLENPLGCYELSRFEGATFDERYGRMMAEVMSVFQPAQESLPDAQHWPESPRPARKPEVVT
jgi:2,4-dienoyl-CoA reductase (NADPH2)